MALFHKCNYYLLISQLKLPRPNEPGRAALLGQMDLFFVKGSWSQPTDHLGSCEDLSPSLLGFGRREAREGSVQWRAVSGRR